MQHSECAIFRAAAAEVPQPATRMRPRQRASTRTARENAAAETTCGRRAMAAASSCQTRWAVCHDRFLERRWFMSWLAMRDAG
jgi:hypothetical protein